MKSLTKNILIIGFFILIGKCSAVQQSVYSLNEPISYETKKYLGEILFNEPQKSPIRAWYRINTKYYNERSLLKTKQELCDHLNAYKIAISICLQLCTNVDFDDIEKDIDRQYILSSVLVSPLPITIKSSSPKHLYVIWKRLIQTEKNLVRLQRAGLPLQRTDDLVRQKDILSKMFKSYLQSLAEIKSE